MTDLAITQVIHEVHVGDPGGVLEVEVGGVTIYEVEASVAPELSVSIQSNPMEVEVRSEPDIFAVQVVEDVYNVSIEGGSSLVETGGGSGVPEYFNSSGSDLPEGDQYIQGPAQWNTSKAIIKDVTVVTAASNWDLWLLQNNSGLIADDAVIPALKIMEGGNGNETITIDRAFQDENSTNRINLHFRDNIGSNSFSIHVTGSELA